MPLPSENCNWASGSAPEITRTEWLLSIETTDALTPVWLVPPLMELATSDSDIDDVTAMLSGVFAGVVPVSLMEKLPDRLRAAVLAPWVALTSSSAAAN